MGAEPVEDERGREKHEKGEFVSLTGESWMRHENARKMASQN